MSGNSSIWKTVKYKVRDNKLTEYSNHFIICKQENYHHITRENFELYFPKPWKLFNLSISNNNAIIKLIELLPIIITKEEIFYVIYKTVMIHNANIQLDCDFLKICVAIIGITMF